MCLSILYLSFCPCLVLRGFSFSSENEAVTQRFVVLSPLCFLVCFHLDSPPDYAEVQEGYRVNVLFHAREDFDNAFYKVP